MLNLYSIFLITLLIFSSSTQSSEPIRYELPFTIGFEGHATSLDPQYKISTLVNNTIAEHVFDKPYYIGKNARLKSRLIKKHKVEDPNRWLFSIKQGVKFHDGHELTSDDFIATFDRLRSRGKQNAFRLFFGDLGYEKVSKYQFRLITPKPNPELPYRLLGIAIISKDYKDADGKEFESGKALTGTGPYRFVKQTDMKEFELKAFEDYHEGAPFLKHVFIKTVADRNTRMTEFKAGKLDLIENLNAMEVDSLLESQRARLSTPKGTRLTFIAMDQHRDQSPYLFDNAGNPLKNNPFKNRRVREALSKVIDRQQLAEQFYGGQRGAAAWQFIPEGYPGYMSNWKQAPVDPIIAKQLLADAGYPAGFRMTLHGKHARKPVLEEIALMLAKINITAEVETFSDKEYDSKAYNHEFSVVLANYNTAGNINNWLTSVVRTGRNSNIGRYSNPSFDNELINAGKHFDENMRYRGYSYAMEMALIDHAVVPLFFVNPAWAIRKDMAFIPNAQPETLAQLIGPNSER